MIPMIKNNKEFINILNKAITYLSYQPRSILEVKKFLLKKKQFNKEMVKKTIEYLIDKEYLDDKSYAKLYIESKAKRKPKSIFALRFELYNKGIDHSITDLILDKYDDRELAKKAVEPKMRAWYGYTESKFKKKLMNFLQYRGFSYDICASTLDYYLSLKKTNRGNDED